MCDPRLSKMPLPSGWPENVKSAVLYVISLAHYAITCARGWAANSINARVRLAAEDDRLKQETELLREELRIKDTRMAKLDPRRRPYYSPTERMAILQLKAVRGWSLAQTAKAFLVQPRTIASWLKRTDEQGDAALVQLRDRPAANQAPRIEPRSNWPPTAACAAPAADIDGAPGRKVSLVVSFHAGRKHLPAIQLRRVA